MESAGSFLNFVRLDVLYSVQTCPRLTCLIYELDFKQGLCRQFMLYPNCRGNLLNCIGCGPSAEQQVNVTMILTDAAWQREAAMPQNLTIDSERYEAQLRNPTPTLSQDVLEPQGFKLCLPPTPLKPGLQARSSCIGKLEHSKAQALKSHVPHHRCSFPAIDGWDGVLVPLYHGHSKSLQVRLLLLHRVEGCQT